MPRMQEETPSVTPATQLLVYSMMSHLQNDLYCVERDVKLYYTIPIV